MGEGDWPKSDGDVLFASEANTCYAGIIPIGCPIPWLKSLAGVPALPSNWVECNGQTLSDADSPLNGQVIPNLNGNANFLYGAETSGGTKTEGFMPEHSHTISIYTGSGNKSVAGRSETADSTLNTGNSSAGTAWVGYAVVYIMRVK